MKKLYLKLLNLQKKSLDTKKKTRDIEPFGAGIMGSVLMFRSKHEKMADKALIQEYCSLIMISTILPVVSK